jgi:flagellar basal body P-ring formation protein FlgA
MKKTLGSFVLLMGVLAAIPVAALTHRETITIDRDSIRLSDVFNEIAADKDEVIATAPLAGRSVTYDYNVLSKLSERYALGWQGRHLKDKTIITRAAQTITAEMIRRAVIEQVKNSGLSGDMDVALDQRNLEIHLPATAAADFALHDFTFDRGTGRFRAQLLAAVDTPAFQQTSLSGRIAILVVVPILANSLASGTVLAANDLSWVKMPLDRAGDVLRDPAQIVGRALRRQMPEQSSLRPGDVLPPRLVLRGNLVTMQVKAAGMALTAQGRALQDGASGEVIRVTNTQSNRVVDAKIIGAGLVQIEVNPQFAALP